MHNHNNEITSLKLQLQAKQEAFDHAIMHEIPFDEVKAIYLEIKELKKRLEKYSQPSQTSN